MATEQVEKVLEELKSLGVKVVELKGDINASIAANRQKVVQAVEPVEATIKAALEHMNGADGRLRNYLQETVTTAVTKQFTELKEACIAEIAGNARAAGTGEPGEDNLVLAELEAIKELLTAPAEEGTGEPDTKLADQLNRIEALLKPTEAEPEPANQS